MSSLAASFCDLIFLVTRREPTTAELMLPSSADSSATGVEVVAVVVGPNPQALYETAEQAWQ